MEEKLKTLKDIKMQGSAISIANNYEDIRQEAIKWIKEDIENYRKHLRDVIKGKEINNYTMYLINKWKNRFNITEEDLIGKEKI